MVFSLVNAFCVPLSLSFEPAFLEDKVFLLVNYTIDAMFFVDIVLSFRTTFIDDAGEEEKRPYYIAKEYL